MATPVVRGQPKFKAHPVASSSNSADTGRRTAIQEALDRVLASPAFRTSKRSQDFLRYAMDHTMAGRLEHLKERSIGAALFGRAPDYDTGGDAIVRVTASDVRKRLLQYYATEGTAHPLMIHLTAGSYLPEIRILSPEPPHETVSVPAPARVEGGSLRIIAASGWLTALGLGIVLAVGLWRRPAPVRALGELPWNGIFVPGKIPEVIMADSAMGALRTLRDFPLTLEGYADRSFLVPDAGVLTVMRPAWMNLTRKQFTSVADARIVAGISQLAGGAGRGVAARYARDLQLVDFHRGDNLILLGSHLSNPWVGLFDDQLHFQIESDANNNQEVIHIQHPKPGDPASLATLVRSGSTGQAYAVLAYLKGLGGNGHVLIAEGTNMEGTDVAGALALNPAALRRELRLCGLDPSKPNSHFEILMQLRATAGGVRSSGIIARSCTPLPD